MLLQMGEYVVGNVLYIFLMIIYIPLYLLGQLTIQRNLLLLRLKKHFGVGVTTSKLGLLSRRSRVTDILQVSTEEEIDFQCNRSLAYVERMAFGTPKELVNTVLRKQMVDLISDEQLVYVVLSTVYAHSVSWDEDHRMYRLTMGGFDELYLFDGFFWEVRHVLVRADASKIVIEMETGEKFNSDATDPLEKNDYKLAKLHAQICLSYYAPGLSHNYVHFVFPSAVCVSSKLKLNHDKALYKLLSPHFRFTERINYQAVRVGKATNNKRSKLDRLFFFWQAFPVTKEQFTEGVAKKCMRYYVGKGANKCEDNNAYNLSSKANNCNGSDEEKTAVIEETDHCRRRHFLFPPEYVTDPQLLKLPYLAFLREYYLVIRRFVKDMIPFIDKHEWEELSTAVAQHVPRFDEADVIDALATFIHQVGVVHHCDHHSYLDFFARQYGCMALRTPFESFKNVDHWNEVIKAHGLNLSSVKKNPLLLLRQRDVMRTRCFLNIFVEYLPNPKCDMSLANTDYGFEEAGARQAAANFLKRLSVLDKRLKTQVPPLKIPAVNHDKRATGMQLIKLDGIVRSVCY